MDLLGSILGQMEKPPSMSDADKKKLKAQKQMIEKQQDKERQKLEEFRQKIETRINNFIKDGTQEKIRFEPMDKTQRAIVHEVADIASLSSFSFGLEEQDRYAMIWKKEFAPSDEELLAYRRDEEWDPEKAKQILELRTKELEEAKYKSKKVKSVAPASNYRDKYKHLIGETAAKDAAQSTVTKRSYGFVSSENKRDQRTIEQVLAESRERKKLKTGHSQCVEDKSLDNDSNSKSNEILKSDEASSS